jgi:multicomponent Na+:H+ antiporter subunit D
MGEFGFLLPVTALATSLAAGIIIFLLPEEKHSLRTGLNLFAAVFKLAVIIFAIWGVSIRGETYEARVSIIVDLDLVLRFDSLSLLFAGLSASLWLVTTIYAIGYLEGSPNRSRFFGFFSLCVASTMGIALAGNLITFVLFYEMLTLTTYPMVVHRGTPESLAAGRTYLIYTLSGGTLLLVGAVWLQVLAGPVEFTPGGALGALEGDNRSQLIVLFALLIASLGVKAAIFPLHGWLPVAMVAPAPVSALLHAVAVVKAGAFGIVRVVYHVYGVDLTQDLGLLLPLSIAASITIVFGSLRALQQNDIKRRLAFSTVSQLSYIALGTGIFGPFATTGALVHLVHQGIMKITLFFCAGNLAETLEIHRISEIRGVGRRMPVTMTAFTVAGLGMIGLPPMAGFVSKWYLGLGALEGDDLWVLLILATSSFLNAAYFLPPIYQAWFGEPAQEWTQRRERGRFEAPWTLLLPPVVTAFATVWLGLFAGAPFSALEIAQTVLTEVYP